MTNQAREFRQLALGVAPPRAAGASCAQILVVSGGQAGVGATTIAVKLATALAQDAQRVVLVDADPLGAKVAAYCGLVAQPNISDVFAGKKSIHEALQRAPAGMQILAGSAAGEATAAAPRGLTRLRRQLGSLQRHTDWIIIDAGHQATELTSQLWSAADQMLLITAPDAAAVMDTYALVKTLLTRQPVSRQLSLVVNLADGPADAADVFRRIDQSCRRFLGISLMLAGFVPADPAATASDHAPSELNPTATASPFMSAINRLARHITAPPQVAAPARRMAA